MWTFRPPRTSWPTPPRSAKAATCAMEPEALTRLTRSMRSIRFLTARLGAIVKPLADRSRSDRSHDRQGVIPGNRARSRTHGARAAQALLPVWLILAGAPLSGQEMKAPAPVAAPASAQAQ